MNALPERKSPRLQGYDYSQAGAYFVTICTHQRLHLFGEIQDGMALLNQAGHIADACWQIIPDHYLDVELDGFVIMPNHMHGIVSLNCQIPAFKTLVGRVINAYKGAVTAQIRKQQSPDMIVWQARYHDHIIRDENDMNRIRTYVENNPARWSEDIFYTVG